MHPPPPECALAVDVPQGLTVIPKEGDAQIIQQFTTTQTVFNTVTNNYVTYQLQWWVAEGVCARGEGGERERRW